MRIDAVADPSRVPRRRGILQRAGVLLVYVILWEAASRAVGQPLLLPSPGAVAARWFSLLPQPLFWRTLLHTFARTAFSYALGVATAVPLSMLCCRFTVVELFLSPLLSAVRATPVTSFIVLALVWLSSGRVPVLTGFLMTLPVVFASLTQAIRGIDPKLLEMARAYDLGPLGTMRHVVCPAILPAFAQSCLAAIGLCWKAVVAAEVISVPKLAIGSRLYEAKIYLETDSLLAWTLTVVLLSVMLETLLRHAVSPWIRSEARHD